jgi:hypothetical protein
MAELGVHHGAGARDALQTARSRTIVDADLRGAARYAAARFKAEHGLLIHKLTRKQCVDAATRLFARPADPPVGERELLRQLGELVEPEPEPFLDGPVLGGCHRCGAPVCDGGPTIGLYYSVAGRAGKSGRHEWRSFSPAVERGDYEPRAVQQKRAGAERRSQLLAQARSGEAPLLCSSCTTRARYKLIQWPAIDELEEPADALEPNVEVDELAADAPESDGRRRDPEEELLRRLAAGVDEGRMQARPDRADRAAVEVGVEREKAGQAGSIRDGNRPPDDEWEALA